jgi:SpoIIAA-like
MLHIEALPERGIVIINPDGPLDKTDFQRLAEQIDPVVASKGKLGGLMICTPSFPGWTSFGAFSAHLRFVRDRHRQIERLAVVTDSGFLKIMPRIANHLVHPQVRHFGLAQRDQALAWLETGR